MLDVVVVGAGPTGSHAAYRLAKMGYNVTVLDKRSSAGLKNCCTGILSQECIRRFNIPPEIIYRQIKSANLFSPSGDLIRICQPETQASVVNRSAFDRHLTELAQRQGVKYFFNTSVESVQKQVEKVVLSCRTKERISTFDARTVILACGFNTSLVRNSGLGQCRYFTTGVQSEVHMRGLEEIEIYFGSKVAPGFFAWLVPTHDDRVLAGLMSHHAAGFYLKSWLIDLEKKNRINSGFHSMCYAGVPMYPLARTYDDRLLVIGDAAGQVKPSTGGGIYFGLLCSDIAAETLHKGLNTNKLSANDLSVYQHEWHKLLKNELRSEYLGRRMYQHLSDGRLDKIFTIAKSRHWAEKVLSNNTVAFDWHGKALFRYIWRGLSLLP